MSFRRFAALAAAASACAGALPPTASGAGELSYEQSKTSKLAAGGTKTKSVSCPNGTSVVSGGVDIIGKNTATAISESFPFDTPKDSDSKPDDGWRGTAISRSAGDKAMRTHAVCAGKGKFKYVAPGPITIFDGTDETSYYSGCPDGAYAVGGGNGFSGPNNPGLVITDIATSDDGDDGSIPDDYWVMGIRNVSGDDRSVQLYTVCARNGSYEYVESDTGIFGGSQLGWHASCPTGTKSVGGGLLSLGPNTEVAASTPYDNADPRREPDDGWIGVLNNNDAGMSTLDALAICT